MPRGPSQLVYRVRDLSYLFLVSESFCFHFGVDGGAGLGEGGRDGSRRVVEGGACDADGDAREVDAVPLSSYDAEREVVLLGLLCELVLTAGVLAKADFEEDERAVLAVEGVGVRVGIGWSPSGVDDVRGGSCYSYHQDV